jgi:hypothetical protein
VKLSLAALVLVAAACSSAPSEPAASSDALGLYAATYSALRGTGAAPYLAPIAVSEPVPDPMVASATPEPPEIEATPSDLFGLDEAAITALLGPAHYTRNEPPARVLQYAGLTCVLDLFLYPEGPNGTLATVYFEMRPTGDAPAPSGCFTGFVLAARRSVY